MRKSRRAEAAASAGSRCGVEPVPSSSPRSPLRPGSVVLARLLPTQPSAAAEPSPDRWRQAPPPPTPNHEQELPGARRARVGAETQPGPEENGEGGGGARGGRMGGGAGRRPPAQTCPSRLLRVPAAAAALIRLGPSPPGLASRRGGCSPGHPLWGAPAAGRRDPPGCHRRAGRGGAGWGASGPPARDAPARTGRRGAPASPPSAPARPRPCWPGGPCPSGAARPALTRAAGARLPPPPGLSRASAWCPRCRPPPPCCRRPRRGAAAALRAPREPALRRGGLHRLETRPFVWCP